MTCCSCFLANPDRRGPTHLSSLPSPPAEQCGRVTGGWDTAGPGKQATPTATSGCKLRPLCLCLQAGAAHTVLAQQGDAPGAGALQLPSHAAFRASCHWPHVWVRWVWAGVQWGWPVLPCELFSLCLWGLLEAVATCRALQQWLPCCSKQGNLKSRQDAGSGACAMLPPGLLPSL